MDIQGNGWVGYETGEEHVEGSEGGQSTDPPSSTDTTVLPVLPDTDQPIMPRRL